ncbi:MAG: hypothetical protein BWY65_02378 [Firmicutes bacterium ADurb.Bin373]|nr:MAG: hypothetical protein BWY65_02378 [Firmicutes bacterium ADurb.Bin373]
MRVNSGKILGKACFLRPKGEAGLGRDDEPAIGAKTKTASFLSQVEDFQFIQAGMEALQQARVNIQPVECLLARVPERTFTQDIADLKQ